MGLSKTDKAYAYGVGMLEQAIKSAVSDLEAGRSERALDSLKQCLRREPSRRSSKHDELLRR